MKADTPLPEVARMLPAEAAALLQPQLPEIQTLICTRVRDALVFLEKINVILDPITYEGVVTLLVAQDLPVAHQIRGLLIENKELKERHGST